MTKPKWLLPCLFFLLPCSLYLLVTATSAPAAIIQVVMLLTLLLTTGGMLLRFRKCETKEERIPVLISAILVAGCILRVGYMLYTPADVRGHDVGGLNLKTERGHAAYLLTLLQNHQLPQTNRGQFYQQPVYYFLAAPLSWLLNRIIGKADSAFALLDGAKLISCFASCGTLLLSRKFCDTMKLKPRGTAIALSLVAFLPNFYLLAGRVGPDALTIFLMLLAFWLTAVWMQTPDWKNTVFLALTYGVAMSTKISCGTFALFTAVCMILVLRREKKAGNRLLPLFGKLAVFGCISLPLGMWYSIRNFLRFGQELGYVMRISETSELYRGNDSMLRLFVPYLNELTATPFADPWTDKSYPVYWLKTALFGEFTYSVPRILPVLLLALNLLLVVLAIFAGISLFFKKDNNRPAYLRNGVPAMWAVLYVSSLAFNITLPFGCTMDFRYIVPTAIFGAISLGVLYENTTAQTETAPPLPTRILRSAIPALCIVFSVFSMLMFSII